LKPKFLRKTSEDELETIREAYVEQVYKPNWFNFEKQKIRKIIDIGGLIGSFTLWAQEQWPNATIHVYEPDPDSFDLLAKNIKQTKSKKIFPFNLAVWKKDGNLILHRFSNTPGSNSVIHKKRPFTGNYQGKIKIKTQSMKKALKKIGGNVDILKLDCEGAEYEILYSLSKRELKKIKFLVLEYHEFDNKPKRNPEALTKFLRRMGFAAQIVPTDIRKKMSLGYIYASHQGKLNNILNTIFDEESRHLTKLEQLAAEREKYAKELALSVKEKEVSVSKLEQLAAEREKYAKELEQSVQEKEASLKKLNQLASEREKYAKELALSVKEKEVSVSKLEQSVQEKNYEITRLSQIIEIQNKELIELRTELSEIKRSVIFKILKRTTKKLESDFPNGTKRGEFKKIVGASLDTIDKDGFRNYLSQVKNKINRHEFKVLTPTNLSEQEEQILIRTVEKNRKNRLKIKPHDEKEIKNDEFDIQEDTNLI